MWQKFKLIFCLKCIASSSSSSLAVPISPVMVLVALSVVLLSNYGFDTCRTLAGVSRAICQGHPSCHIRHVRGKFAPSLHPFSAPPPFGQVKGDRWPAKFTMQPDGNNVGLGNGINVIIEVIIIVIINNNESASMVGVSYRLDQS